jgi:hypothetical protein
MLIGAGILRRLKTSQISIFEVIFENVIQT